MRLSVIPFALACASCCTLNAAVFQPVPKTCPLPCSQPLPEPPPKGEPGTFAWSFERDDFDGWVVDEGHSPRTDRPVLADAAGISLPLRGDYWRTPVDVGQHGRWRIDTTSSRGTRTRVHSPEHALRLAYVSLRVGGGGGAGTRVELQLRDLDWKPVRHTSGPGSVGMVGVAWDVRDLAGRVARVAVVDDGAGNGLLVDDVRDTASAPPARPAPLWGFADMHAHTVSQFAFGRHVVVGENDGPMQQALSPQICEREHGKCGRGGKAGPAMSVFEKSFDGSCGHRNGGWPTFDGWPRSTTLGHQQMHWQWIERAWQGGLRLMVAQLVNNELLAANFHDGNERNPPPFDDMSVIAAQADALRSLVAHHDFMEIAETPADARRIIGAGKLAVVLGVEVDSIGGCRREIDCDAVKVKRTLRSLWHLGVRHLFPIHLADNAFGGSSMYHDGMWELLSWYLRGSYRHVANDRSVAFRLDFADEGPAALFATASSQPNLYGQSPYTPPFDEYARANRGGHVNPRGITPLGYIALAEMRKMGMIVDIDHMSQAARDDTLDLFERTRVPVVMSHSWFRDIGYARDETDDSVKMASEVMKTRREIERVRDLGGAIAAITNQGDVKRVPGDVEPECAGASTSWLDAYVYAVGALGDGAAVGLGTDFNGLAQQPGPRFGPYACLGLRTSTGGNDCKRARGDFGATLAAMADAQQGGVTYATPMSDPAAHRFHGAGDRPYGADERAVWIAIARSEAHASPDASGDRDCDASTRAVVFDVASGFADGDATGSAWRQAAFLAKNGKPRPVAAGELQRRYDTVVRVWTQWRKMEGDLSGNRAAPLVRYVVPGHPRDFDVNVDGLAHYGLLPDFLQDVSNQLRRAPRPYAEKERLEDLRAVFRSAEVYVATWERVEAASDPGR